MLMKSIVIVGGGVGGVFTANKLASKLAAEIKKGVGIFTGQRLIQCGRSKMAEYVTAIVMLATAVWIAIS